MAKKGNHAKTVTGSKALHQFVDIGEEGKLLVCKRPCHQHDGCMRQDQKAIMSCVRSDVCGVAKLVEIGTKGSPNVPLTRNALQLAGHALAEKALDGSFLVVEVSCQS